MIGRRRFHRSSTSNRSEKFKQANFLNRNAAAPASETKRGRMTFKEVQSNGVNDRQICRGRYLSGHRKTSFHRYHPIPQQSLLRFNRLNGGLMVFPIGHRLRRVPPRQSEQRLANLRGCKFALVKLIQRDEIVPRFKPCIPPV
jgi:hypothetical protein